jgi:ComF family protein
MTTRLATLWNGFRHLVMPGICHACHRALPLERDDFCDECLGKFARDPHATCRRCSSTVGPHLNLSEGCTRCRDEGFAFDRAVRLGPYDGLLRDLILRMKQPGNEGLAEAVGHWWAATSDANVRAFGANLIVPVPLHWWRRWQRGFNQSELLANAWAERLGVAVRPRWLWRVRATVKQSTLSPTARRENVKGAFRVSRRANVRGQSVLLVDDVLTSGSTASEAARALLKAGAGSVAVAILAHAIK